MTALRQPAVTGFAMRDPLSWRSFSELVRRGEALGYAAVFLPEIAGRDALAALAALAGETDRLALATGIVPMRSRTPALTAMAAATVHERSGGRAILGLGTGPSGAGALDELRRLVLQLRRAFAGERVEDHGAAWSLTLDPGGPIPIWISALGPNAVRLGGEIADGILLNWCSPERVAEARRSVRDAAERAGRDPALISIAVYIRGAFDPDGPEALRRAAGEYASYPAYARQFASMGLGAHAEVAAAAHRSGRPQDVPGELVDAVCLPGEVGAALGRLDEYRGAGADLPVVYPVAAGADAPASVRATIEALAPSPTTDRT